MNNRLKTAALIFCIAAVAFFIRTLNFSQSLNFLEDQAIDSISAYDLLVHKKISLIGSSTAYQYKGRYIFQGPLITWGYAAFIGPAGFDPYRATLLFTLFASLSVIPLFIAVRKLTDFRTALITAVVYAVAPYYVSYTRFLWNPNFQLALFPYFLLILAHDVKNKTKLSAMLLGVAAGLMLHFHYQFTLIIGAMLLYLLISKRGLITSITYVIGCAFGFSPVLLFELRHSFYNLNTIVLFLSHPQETLSSTKSSNLAYYMLSSSLLILPFMFQKAFKTVSYNVLVPVLLVLTLFSVGLFSRKPTHPFLFPHTWFYSDEILVNNIIRSQNLTNFEVSMLHYNNTAAVQKYLFKVKGTKGLAQSYFTNTYLFAVSENRKLEGYSAYELQEMAPYKVLRRWHINNTHTLYLFRRT